jgi:hypothetical protein
MPNTAFTTSSGDFAVRQLPDGTWLVITPDNSRFCFNIRVAPIALPVVQGNAGNIPARLPTALK